MMITQEKPSARKPAESSASYRPIADYGVIGDMHSAMLISADGSIDWGCLPDFDSPAMFLRLLDCGQGGYCSVEVPSAITKSRRYLERTNILETTFVAPGGRLVLSDFMPVQKRRESEPTGKDDSTNHCVIRLLRCTEGAVDVSFAIKPTFSFASETTRVYSRGDGMAVFTGRHDALQVQCPNLTAHDDGRAAAQVPLRAGGQVCVVRAYGKPGTSIRAWSWTTC
jgi:GH15 family glucan-1,4-alpha-glucosidase